MQFRHEWKHEINVSDMLILRTRLRAVMKPDEHAVKGVYHVRSLYFDNPADKALREKTEGVNRREKFRLRYYNRDPDFILLEKKSKINGLCGKESCMVSKAEAQKIVDGDYGWMIDPDRPLCAELYAKIRWEMLGPKTIVDYTREPFVYSPGNIRVTIDRDIRTGLFRTDFLDPSVVTLPAGDAPMILEVKWDHFLPDIIKDAVTLKGRRVSAFSKYQICRIYG